MIAILLSSADLGLLCGLLGSMRAMPGWGGLSKISEEFEAASRGRRPASLERRQWRLVLSAIEAIMQARGGHSLRPVDVVVARMVTALQQRILAALAQ